MHCLAIDLNLLARLWKGGVRSDKICEKLGCTRGHLGYLVRKHSLGRRPPRFSAARNTETPNPTLEEIAAATAAIRATWTPAEREARRVGCRHKPVEAPHFYFHREQWAFST
jgi:hypothetical protein